MSQTVQVINATYEPLQVVPIQHAIRMLSRGVAVVEEALNDTFIGVWLRPKVIRLIKFVKTTWQYARAARYSKNGILNRDKFTCAFCGKTANTVDHLLPRAKGGISSWMNCVAACKKCNNKKAARTPEEAGMRLLFQPFEPTIHMVEGRVLFL